MQQLEKSRDPCCKSRVAAPEISKEAERLADSRVEIACRKLEAQLQRAREDAAKMERQMSRKIDQARREADKQAKRAAAKQNELKFERLQHERDQDRSRYYRQIEQLQRTVDNLQRKLESQTSEQLGDEAEVNLLSELNAEFTGDRIKPVRRGAKGADIVHEVMDGPKSLGRIVYESKNVSTWQNGFVATAKSYQTQYDTPYVLIVSRVLPKKKRGLCNVKGIPVVEPRMAIALAQILRDAITEIASMRLSNSAREEKAQDLFNYVLSNEFATRFRQIGDNLEELREQQRKERDWHDKTWQNESNLYDKIDSDHRHIAGRIKTITRDARTQGNGKLRVVASALQ